MLRILFIGKREVDQETIGICEISFDFDESIVRASAKCLAYNSFEENIYTVPVES